MSTSTPTSGGGEGSGETETAGRSTQWKCPREGPGLPRAEIEDDATRPEPDESDDEIVED